MRKNLPILVILAILLIPTFFKMLPSGLYTMQDFHFFRLVEFHKCARDFQVPCRWSPDAGLGYGEPLFNFYGQMPYVFGEFFHLIGISQIVSLKLLFILSLVGSGISMFFLSRQIWGNNLSAILSALFYVYAPYRAVDVWVRGALPEALAFVIFPLILFKINCFFESKKNADLLWISFLVALLITTHNLSVVLISPVLVIWILYKLINEKKWTYMPALFFSAVFSLILSAFYLLPVLAESKYVLLNTTTQGFYDFHVHFVTLYQLLISNFWGYGASVWGPNDGLSLSVGYLQWILPLLALLFIIMTRKTKKYKKLFVLVFSGWFALFLTHNKSTFIWETLSPFMSYIQFPWRFLSASVFSFSLAAGVIPSLLPKHKKILTFALLIFVIVINFGHFHEDIWMSVKDSDLKSGESWIIQRSASIKDYWHIFGNSIPSSPAPQNPFSGKYLGSGSNWAKYKINLTNNTEVQFPISYFPGWKGFLNGQDYLSLYSSGNFGLITASLPQGESIVELRFVDTPVRTVGNFISLISLLFLLAFALKQNVKIFLKQ